jgi:hypothetical protein
MRQIGLKNRRPRTGTRVDALIRKANLKNERQRLPRKKIWRSYKRRRNWTWPGQERSLVSQGMADIPEPQARTEGPVGDHVYCSRCREARPRSEWRRVFRRLQSASPKASPVEVLRHRDCDELVYILI